MMMQQRYELLREEIINMQTFAETSGYVNNASGPIQSRMGSPFEVAQQQRPSILQSIMEGNHLNLQKALFFSI